tara:strand:+ start:1356 stop:2054 length:699 start_codon:yes stop_codon:yes gene_type:complete
MEILDLIPAGWEELWEQEIKKGYFKPMIEKVKQEYQDENRIHQEIFPPKGDILRVFNIMRPEQIKAVILGQDPYHEKNQADGLAFSFKGPGKTPPSLKNILLELETAHAQNTKTDLTNWTENGVFLLNSILTVKEGKALSHQHIGWERFTDAVIKYISDNNNNLTFLLWGKHAHDKRRLICDNRGHYIDCTSHPSPLSARRRSGGYRPFSGSKCFHVLKEKSGVDLMSYDEI